MPGLGGGAGDAGSGSLALERLREGLGDRALVLDEQDVVSALVRHSG